MIEEITCPTCGVVLNMGAFYDSHVNPYAIDENHRCKIKNKRNENIMNELEKNALQAVEELAPTAPAVEVAEAAISTITNPTVETLMADIKLAYDLVKEFKTKLSGLHPSVLNLIKAAFTPN